MFWIDILAIILFTFGLIPIAWKLFVNITLIQEYSPFGSVAMNKQFFDIMMYLNLVDDSSDKYTDQTASFMIQYFAGPGQLASFYHIIDMLLFTMSGQYGGMIYFGIPLIPDLIWYNVLELIFPWLATPTIAFEKWGEEDLTLIATQGITGTKLTADGP